MNTTRTYPVYILVLGLFVACSSPPPEVSGQQRPAVAGQDEWSTDFSKAIVPLEEITSGGPPKDGIRSIDRPDFVTIDEADDWLGDREPVAVVKRNGVTKAYPLSILIWHEIVNDEIGGDPVTVTYCPLCNTTIAVDRNFDGRVLEFGTTGRLRHSDLVMYDRQSETWWQQATGEGLVGEYAGERLTLVPATVMSWRDVKEQLGEALVLSRDTGFPADFRERYGNNPYQGYDRGTDPGTASSDTGAKTTGSRPWSVSWPSRVTGSTWPCPSRCWQRNEWPGSGSALWTSWSSGPPVRPAPSTMRRSRKAGTWGRLRRSPLMWAVGHSLSSRQGTAAFAIGRPALSGISRAGPYQVSWPDGSSQRSSTATTSGSHGACSGPTRVSGGAARRAFARQALASLTRFSG